MRTFNVSLCCAELCKEALRKLIFSSFFFPLKCLFPFPLLLRFQTQQMWVCFCVSILSMSSRPARAFKKKEKKILTPTHPKSGGEDVGGIYIKAVLPFIKDYFQQDLKSWSSTTKAPPFQNKLCCHLCLILSINISMFL